MSVRQENRNRRRLQYFNDRRDAMHLQVEAAAQVRGPRPPIEPPQSAATRQQVRRWMGSNASDYDTATALAEAADAALDLPAGAMGDPDHWVWEEAMTAIERAAA